MGNKVFKQKSSSSSSASTTALASSSSSSLSPRSPKSKKSSSKEKRAEASKTSSSSSESTTASTASSVSEPPRGPSSPSTASSTSSVSREATAAVEPSFSIKKIEELFYKYVPEEEKDCDDPLMQPEGVEQFLRDIGLDPEDVAVIVLSWHFKASTMCYYKKSEFTRGMVELQVDNVEKLREKIPTLRTELQDRSKFKEIFEFTFSWSREQDKKFLDVETAVGMLELLLPDQLPLSSPLLSFLKVQTSYPVINKDQWISTLEFVEATDDSLSNYNESESWPVIFDEFVKWVKEKNPEKYSAAVAESDF